MNEWDQIQPPIAWDMLGMTWDSANTTTQPKVPMAKDQTKRIKPTIIQQDKDTLAAIKTLTPAYAPSDAQYSAANLTTAETAMTTSQETEVQKEGEAAAARDTANTAEWAFHNRIQGAKTQVIAQYGEDSDQVQAIGLKKKSEYKKPASRKTAPAAK